MKAAWCTELGLPLQVRVAEVPDPEPGPGEALVAVAAAAVNFPDILLLTGRYQLAATVPFIPGSEFAGTVLRVGPGTPADLVGRRVSGTVLTGAFAELVVAPVSVLQPVPDGLDDVHAAAFTVAYTTAHHALFTIGAARAGDTVVVLGAAGGVGLACVDLAVAAGLRVIAVASSADRVRLCTGRGAAAGVDTSRQDLKQALKDLTGAGADVVVDVVGGEQSEQALRALAWGGRFVVVGFASGEIPRMPLNLVLLKGVVVRGLELRTLHEHLPDAVERAHRDLAALVGAGLRPYVSRTVALADVGSALQSVADRHGTGKLVVSLAAG